jgi:hypothetical protein
VFVFGTGLVGLPTFLLEHFFRFNIWSLVAVVVAEESSVAVEVGVDFLKEPLP